MKKCIQYLYEYDVTDKVEIGKCLREVSRVIAELEEHETGKH